MSLIGHFATDQYDSDPEDREATEVKIPTPHPMASFRETDAWLVDRGWQVDGRSWRSIHRGRVTIATHEEAVRIQRRRDRRPGPQRSAGEAMKPGKLVCIVVDYWHEEHRPYRTRLHDESDGDVGQSDLTDAIEASGARDGDEIEISIRVTGRRPFGDRKYRWVSPHTYEREPSAAPPPSAPPGKREPGEKP